MKYVFGMILVIGLLWLWSCEENPVNYPLPGAQMVSDTLYATFDTTHTINKDISTLASERLLIGSHSGFTFRIIMRFVGFPDSVTIENAWIRFNTLGAVGEMPEEFTATGYPIKESWIADTSDVWKDYQNNVDFTNPLGEMSVTTGSSDTVFFQFNTFGLTTINNWADTSSGVDNNGLALDFTTANFIKAFQARNSSKNIGPFLFIQYTKDTTTVIDSLLAISDAFLYEGQFQSVPDRNMVTTLLPRATVLTFNLDTLKQKYPDGIIVETANLELTIDPNNTLIDPDFGAKLQILPLTSPPADTGVVVDSSFIGIAARTVDFSRFNEDTTFIQATPGSDRQQFARFYIQTMLNSPERYEGFYIDFTSVNQFFSYFSFYRYNAPDISVRPRLIIQSLRLPDERL